MGQCLAIHLEATSSRQDTDALLHLPTLWEKGEALGKLRL